MYYSAWLDDIYHLSFFLLLFLAWRQLWAAQLTVPVLCSYPCVCALWLFFAGTVQSQSTGYRARVDLALELSPWQPQSGIFPFKQKCDFSRFIIKTWKIWEGGSWEEGCWVHCAVVVLMETQFHLGASREAAVSPFCYCGDQARSPTDSQRSTSHCCHSLFVQSAPQGPSSNAYLHNSTLSPQRSAIMSAGQQSASLRLWVIAAGLSLHRDRQRSTQLQVLFRTKLRNLWTNSFAQLFIYFCINFLYFFIQYDATQLKCVNLNGNNLCFVNAVCHFVELVFILLLLFSHFF